MDEPAFDEADGLGDVAAVGMGAQAYFEEAGQGSIFFVRNRFVRNRFARERFARDQESSGEGSCRLAVEEGFELVG